MNEYFEKQSLARAEAILGGLELPVYAVARVLRKFHAAASFAGSVLENAADVSELRGSAQQKLTEFLIPLDPPEPVFDRAVWRASDEILSGLEARNIDAVDGLLPTLQQLFEEGRKQGSMGQEIDSDGNAIVRDRVRWDTTGDRRADSIVDSVLGGVERARVAKCQQVERARNATRSAQVENLVEDIVSRDTRCGAKPANPENFPSHNRGWRFRDTGE